MWSTIANFKDNLSQIASDVLDTADELKRGGSQEDYEEELYDDPHATSHRSSYSEKEADLKAELEWYRNEVPRLQAVESEIQSSLSRYEAGSEAAIPPWLKALSGSLGGTVEAMCLQPIDVIKTRLQLDHVKQYNGIVHCGSTVIKTEGVRALWKGLTPFATHLTLKYTLRMGSNAMFQTALTDSKTGKLSNGGRLAAGFGAGVLEALVIVTPFEVVKIRLQQQRGLAPHMLKYRGPIQCATRIVREEGLVGLWAGAAPTVMRNGTNQMVMFSAKNMFDHVLWKKQEGDGKTLQPWQSMCSGFLAGTAGPIATGPFDVVKTRLMAQTRYAVAGVQEHARYTGMFNALHRIFVDEGIRALWKGLLPRLMRIPPGQAIMWAVADQVTGFYERRLSSSMTASGETNVPMKPVQGQGKDSEGITHP